MAAYRLIPFHIKWCHVAVGDFGPTFDHNGKTLDRETLHTDLAALLDRATYQPIQRPSWVSASETSGPKNWQPSRSDWYLVEGFGTRSYVNIASAIDGIIIEAWITKGVMYHQRSLGIEAMPYEFALSDVLVTELRTLWIQCCDQRLQVP